MANDGKWRLGYGIHAGTFTSRDTDEIPNLDSLQACRDKIREIERDNKRWGYVIWFATAYGPNGEQESVHPGNVDYNNSKRFSEMEQERSPRHDPRFDKNDPYGKRRRHGLL